MRKQTAAAIGTAATIGAATLAWAVPASADLVTRCVGEAGPVTVPGDLVVPRDRSCTLDGTTVEGDVIVRAGADLISDEATLNGMVRVRQDAYFESTAGDIAGPVNLRGAYGTYLEDSEVSSELSTRPNPNVDIGGFVYTFETSVAGDLLSRRGEVFVEASEVSGNLDSRNSYYTDVHDSFLDGTVTVNTNEVGSVFCGVAVQGTASFVNNTELVQLGSDGPFSACSSASYWGDDVQVSGTTDGVYVDNNIIDGALTLTDNDPVALVGPNNMIRRGIVGEYEDWDPDSDAQLERRSALNRVEQRDDVLDRKVAERRAEALASAQKAGAANL